MSGHTPGPWIVDDETRNHGPLVIEQKGTLEIAAVYGDSRDQRAANARLIATAPEFHEAAELVRESHSDLPNGGVEITHEAWTALMDALTKAEGK